MISPLLKFQIYEPVMLYNERQARVQNFFRIAWEPPPSWIGKHKDWNAQIHDGGYWLRYAVQYVY